MPPPDAKHAAASLDHLLKPAVLCFMMQTRWPTALMQFVFTGHEDLPSNMRRNFLYYVGSPRNRRASSWLPASAAALPGPAEMHSAPLYPRACACPCPAYI